MDSESVLDANNEDGNPYYGLNGYMKHSNNTKGFGYT